MSMYGDYLARGLDALFRDSSEKGFWLDSESRILKQLDLSIEDGVFRWTSDETLEYRYGPMGLMGALYWRKSTLGSPDYDSQMAAYLDFLTHKISPEQGVRGDRSAFNHAIVLAALALGALSLPDGTPGVKKGSLVAATVALFRHCRERWPLSALRDNQGLLLLFAYTLVYELLAGRDARELREELARCTRYLCGMQSPEGVFQTGDKRYVYHQRMMYPLWGLTRAISIFSESEEKHVLLGHVERTLDFVIRERKTWDAGFYWHPYVWTYPTRNVYIPWWVNANPRKERYYECHQCFFVYAAEQYRRAGGRHDYSEEVISALNWIFKTNRRGTDLVEETGIGVPLRVVVGRTGRIGDRDSLFKGAYEVGAYIMALTDIAERE